MTRQLAYLGATVRALAELEPIVESGFWCSRVLDSDSWLASIRRHPRFVELRDRALVREREIGARFEAAGGHRLVGLVTS